MDKFNEIREGGRLLMEFVRGSHLYGINTPQSDIDTGGVYICRPEELLGIYGYEPQVSDERHDNTWYEIGNFAHLLCKSNPTVLETLFVPDDKVVGGFIHPYMRMLMEHRDEFVTKECFQPFYGYARSQIMKARGLNKKITNPIVERKTPLDFCYTIRENGGGTENIQAFLDRKGMKARYCGGVALDHMHDVYEIYYDFGSHIASEGMGRDEFEASPLRDVAAANTRLGEGDDLYTVLVGKALGYAGIINEGMNSNQLRLSSIPKGEVPVAVISYNASGYSKHCVDYKQYKEWERNRNPVRYESNLNKNYDSKNMGHCFRMVHMAMEIARGEGVKLDRRGIDADFLLDVRNHKYEYDELIEMLDRDNEEMERLMAESTIPDKIDRAAVNSILIDIRKAQLRDSL